MAFRSAKRLRDGVDARHNAGHDESSIPSLGITPVAVTQGVEYPVAVTRRATGRSPVDPLRLQRSRLSQAKLWRPLWAGRRSRDIPWRLCGLPDSGRFGDGISIPVRTRIRRSILQLIWRPRNAVLLVMSGQNGQDRIVSHPRSALENGGAPGSSPTTAPPIRRRRE